MALFTPACLDLTAHSSLSEGSVLRPTPSSGPEHPFHRPVRYLLSTSVVRDKRECPLSQNRKIITRATSPAELADASAADAGDGGHRPRPHSAQERRRTVTVMMEMEWRITLPTANARRRRLHHLHESHIKQALPRQWPAEHALASEAHGRGRGNQGDPFTIL